MLRLGTGQFTPEHFTQSLTHWCRLIELNDDSLRFRQVCDRYTKTAN